MPVKYFAKHILPSFTFVITTTFFCAVVAALPEQLSECPSINDDKLRLNCYDKFLQDKHKIKNKNRITPPDKFLHAELRVDRNVSEYRLVVADFLELIKVAIMDDNEKIEILGWEKQQHYILHIRMRQSISLVFQHINSKTENFCVLKPVLIDGAIIDPAMFILNIASMSPDD